MKSFNLLSSALIALSLAGCASRAGREESRVTTNMNRILEAPPSGAICAQARNLDSIYAQSPDQSSIAIARARVARTLARCPGNAGANAGDAVTAKN